MTFRTVGPAIAGHQPIADTSTTQLHPLGTIIQAHSATFGSAEFIYLRGIGSTVVGSIVNYDDSFLTALSTTALDTARPVAVAMSANVANSFGWYQISGIAVATKSNAVSFAKGASLAASSGAAIAAVSGLRINGALVAVVASAKSDVTSVRVMVNRPHDPSDLS